MSTITTINGSDAISSSRAVINTNFSNLNTDKLETSTAAATYAPIASPTFTGTVAGITAAMVGAPSGSGTSTGTNTGDQVLFDATAPSTQAYGDAAVVGVATVAAKRDHKHAMPASTKDTTAITGILKGNGTTVSAAANSDLPVMTATVGGAVPTPPNNTTTFLRGDGTFATPSGSGDMVLASIQTVTGAKTFGSAGAVGKLILAGNTSGTSILNAAAVAGATTVTLPGSTTTLVGTDTTDTLTNKTLTTPVINGLPTGTGIASAATVSTVASRDANGNSTFANVIEGFATTATAAGTTTLTVSSAFTQVFTGATTQTVTLPTTGIVAGQSYTIINNSTGAVTVQSSGANTIVVLAGGTSARFTALVATPTTAANWNFWYEADNMASGKKFTVNNTITLAGTDGTTMTFPSTSATIARTDAANTFTGVQTMTSPNFTTPVLGTPTSGTLTNCSGLPVSGITASTATALGVGSVELGHATDTTLSRSAAGVLAVEGVVVPTISSTNTITNKRNTKRVVTTTQAAAPTINTDNGDIFQITGLAQAITSMTTNLTGTPSAGDMMMIQITDNGTARAITWGASFASTTVTLPTTTVISTMLRVLFQRNNANTIWDCVAVA